jgi:hypothetical protein
MPILQLILVGKELLVDAPEGPLSGGGFGGEPSIACGPAS